ncbi:MAG: dephospho-CoA kinase [Chloroflexi bacterium]|nr:dephospho-CoA kinase [Chloroflexota bacterium]
MMKYVIGLTGSIASGKSTVAHKLKEFGAHIIDADIVAHQVMLPGMPAYDQIVAHFGSTILDAHGVVNRRALGALVFANPQELNTLEQISHPAVAALLRDWLAGFNAGILVVEAIKLLEASIHMQCDSVWVVCCTRAQQAARMRARDLNEDQIEQRIAAQPPLHLKLSAAHVLIDNSGDMASLNGQLCYAWQRILALQKIN